MSRLFSYINPSYNDLLVSPSYFVPRGWPNANSFVAYCQF